MTGEVNLHATAIVIGTSGFLITGPSGSGKSTFALSCMAAARRAGDFAALVADDQVFLSSYRDVIVARRPQTIANLLEVRCCGIGTVHSIEKAVMHLVIVMAPDHGERLPPNGQYTEFACGGHLPLIHMRPTIQEPLAAIAALRPELYVKRPFG